MALLEGDPAQLTLLSRCRIERAPCNVFPTGRRSPLAANDELVTA